MYQQPMPQAPYMDSQIPQYQPQSSSNYASQGTHHNASYQ